RIKGRELQIIQAVGGTSAEVQLSLIADGRALGVEAVGSGENNDHNNERSNSLHRKFLVLILWHTEFQSRRGNASKIKQLHLRSPWTHPVDQDSHCLPPPATVEIAMKDQAGT